MTQRERWLLCRTEPFEVAAAHVASLSAEHIREVRWWSAAALRSSGLVTTPRDLAGLLDGIAGGRLPDPETELGV